MGRNSELVFGLIAPLGVDLDAAYESMLEVLEAFDYKVVKVSVSDFLKNKTTILEGGAPKYLDEYIDTLQGAGNKLRQDAGRNDVLALGAVSEINAARSRLRQNGHASTRIAYIVRQLKTPDEEKLFRKVYGSRFSLVGIFSKAQDRERWLAGKIATSRNDGTAWTKYEADARRLIGIDESEDTSHGQQVRATFPLADLFITWRGGEAERGLQTDRSFRAQFKRYISGLMGDPTFVPTTEEFLMAQAQLVAFTSADWSRQVGAVIATRSGSVIAVGRNDDPKVGGGVVSLRQPVDSAFGFKMKTVEEVLACLSDWIKPDIVAKGWPELANEAVTDKLKSTRLMGLGEFGRMVHAEMAAISDAAARGVAVQGQVIFCTTFPCQNCAKHLMSAGIRALVHIEPYAKSLVKEMYESEIVQVPMESLDSREFSKQLEDEYPSKFLLVNFMGVAPRSYDRLFAMPARRGPQGARIAWNPKTAEPRLDAYGAVADYSNVELVEAKALKPWLKVAQGVGADAILTNVPTFD